MKALVILVLLLRGLLHSTISTGQGKPKLYEAKTYQAVPLSDKIMRGHYRTENYFAFTLSTDYDIAVKIPANTNATIYLPAMSTSVVTESGKPIASVKGIHSEGYQDGRKVLNRIG